MPSLPLLRTRNEVVPGSARDYVAANSGHRLANFRNDEKRGLTLVTHVRREPCIVVVVLIDEHVGRQPPLGRYA